MASHNLSLRASLLITVCLVASAFAGSATAQSASPSALAGKVSSAEEGAMEGVIVSAKRAGSTITVSVVSNARGEYSFPKDRLAPGAYAVTIRAVGYELPNAMPAQVEVTARPAALDVNLVKTKDLEHQLSNGEWLQSFPGTKPFKEALFNCTSCHTLERVAKGRYNATDMGKVVQRMSTWAQGSMPTQPQPQLGRKIGPPTAGQAALGKFISTINLSEGDERPYPLKTDPRPTGKATRVIITEYDLPRPRAMPHDAIVDSRGFVWYGDFGAQYIGRLDPKTGKAKEFPIPVTKPGAPTGNLMIQADRDGMIWIGAMMQGSLVKFDPKTEKFQSWGSPDFLTRNEARIAMVVPEQTHLDGKVWIGGDYEYQVDIASGKWTAVDYLKGQPPGAKDHGSYGVAADSKNNFYGMEVNADYIIKVDAKSLIPTYYQTPTLNSGPRRGHFDNQDRLWFAENRGQNIGMFDPKTGKFQEWKVPTPYATPYDAVFDNNTYAWTGGMANDHVTRLNVKTGEIVDYLLPSETNIRRVDVDKSVAPSQLWVGNNHKATLVRVEPLDP